MKYFIIMMCVLVNTYSNSQTAFKKDSTSYSSSITLNKKATFNSHSVLFKELISDSRCPKDAMCVRAGEAKVVVSLYKDDIFISDRELIFHASGYLSDANNRITSDDSVLIFGGVLKPYPNTINKISEKDYILEIVFQPK